MSFYPSYPSSAIQPKIRQEGFHLPSPTPSNGNPPSPTGSNAFDMYLPHHNPGTGPSSHFAGLSLPDAFSRNAGAMDFGDELASLMGSSPATSNERSTHTPPQPPYDAEGNYRPPPHNIFDISAPPNHYGHHGFSLPQHSSHRPDFSLSSQPSSIHSSHAGPGQAQGQPPMGRDGFTGHFNSTIPPLSTHHDPPVPSYAFGGQTPSSARPPSRETPSPSGVSTSTRPDTAHGRSGSRSRSRAPPPTAGPTRTTKTGSKRRDSLSFAHTHLPSPPTNPASVQGTPSSSARPKAIVIPSSSSSHAPLSGRGGGNGGGVVPASPIGLVSPPTAMSQTSGWFLPSQAPSSNTPAGEFSLPTPESVGHHTFGQFGTSVGSMGISPKDTTSISAVLKGESPPDEVASKQAAVVMEKRRRRRESHNAVERRRRDNINEKISELATLIPEVMLNPSAVAASSAASPNPGEDVFSSLVSEHKKEHSGSSAAGCDVGDDHKDNTPFKANKGMILRKSVEYIRYLQQLVSAQAARNRDLEAQLVRAGVGPSKTEDPMNVGGGSLSLVDGVQDAYGIGADDDVLDLHAFTPEGDDGNGVVGPRGANGEFMPMNMMMGMRMGGMGFDHLETMAESNEMETDDQDGLSPGGHGMQSQQSSFLNHLQHSLNGTSGSSGPSSHRRDMSGARQGETSPSAGTTGSGEDMDERNGVDDQDEDDLEDKYKDRDVQRGRGAGREMEERGRRGRDGRVHIKEESSMDV